MHPERPTTASLARILRKHPPDVDLMRAGGRRDLDTMKRSYQHSDHTTTLRVIENEPASGLGGHTADTPQKSSGGISTG